jgi:hypothetical protein
LVLDSDAITEYMLGSQDVGELIAARADDGMTVLVPLLCLIEAYHRADQETVHMLGVLQGVEHVRVIEAEQSDAPFIGGWENLVGSAHLAHAATTAVAGNVVPLLTSQRDLVMKVLPKGWPIYDL